jgi:hypothetical protein
MRRATTFGAGADKLRRNLVDLAKSIIDDPDAKRHAEETETIDAVLRVVKTMRYAMGTRRGPALRLTLKDI